MVRIKWLVLSIAYAFQRFTILFGHFLSRTKPNFTFALFTMRSKFGIVHSTKFIIHATGDMWRWHKFIIHLLANKNTLFSIVCLFHVFLSTPFDYRWMPMSIFVAAINMDSFFVHFSEVNVDEDTGMLSLGGEQQIKRNQKCGMEFEMNPSAAQTMDKQITGAKRIAFFPRKFKWNKHLCCVI